MVALSKPFLMATWMDLYFLTSEEGSPGSESCGILPGREVAGLGIVDC